MIQLPGEFLTQNAFVEPWDLTWKGVFVKIASIGIYTLMAFGASSLWSADMSVQKAQELLKSKGYYSGAVDGINGPKTKAAVNAYQKDQGLDQTGSLDDKTVQRLGSSTTKEAAGSVTGAVKEADTAAKSESSGAMSEMKGAFGKKKKTSATSTTK